MNRRCIFCDNDNYKLSKEHIVAKWLMKELEISKEMMTMGHFNGIGFKLSERKHNASNLVNGLVCEKCNNGWMSELENENTENIINLINCKNADIVLKNIMGSDSFLTAKWAFKNAILLNTATNYRKLVPDSHFKTLYNGNIPKNIHIDIGFTKDEFPIQWMQSQTFIVHTSSKIGFNPQEINDCYKITFKFKYLLIVIVFYDSKYNTYYDNNGTIAIYPESGTKGETKIFNSISEFDLNGSIHEYI